MPSERLFEAKLLGFGENDRIQLCTDCHQRAIEDNFVIFSCALPIDAAPAPESPRGGICAKCGCQRQGFEDGNFLCRYCFNTTEASESPEKKQ